MTLIAVTLLIFLVAPPSCWALVRWAGALEQMPSLIRINGTHFYTAGYSHGQLLVAVYNSDGQEKCKWPIKVEEVEGKISKAALASYGGLIFVLIEELVSALGIVRISPDMRLVAKKELSGVVLCNAWNPSTILVRGNNTVAVFGREPPGLGRDAILELSPTEEIVRTQVFPDEPLEIASRVFVDTATVREDSLLYVKSMKNIVELHEVTLAHGDKLLFALPETNIVVSTALEVTRNRTSPGIVLTGSCLQDNEYDATVCAIEVDRTSGKLRWIWKYRNRYYSPLKIMTEGSQGDSVVYINGVSGEWLLVALSSAGVVRWRRRLISSVDSLIQLGEGEYVYTMGDGSSMEKFTVPPYADRLKCDYLNDCRGCPMGSYWNRTGCVSCGEGCASCVIEGVCDSCLDSYWKSAIDSARCVRRAVGHNRSRSVSPPKNDPSRNECYFTGGATSVSNKGCICDSKESLDNGTHCLQLQRRGCDELCSVCIGAADGGYCVDCVRLPRVMTHRTARLYVDCRCEYGYNWSHPVSENESGCVRNTTASPHLVTKRTHTSTFLLWVVVAGTAILAGTVVCVILRRRELRATALPHKEAEMAATSGENTSQDAEAGRGRVESEGRPRVW